MNNFFIQGRMLTRFIRTEFSFTEVYSIWTYNADGTISIQEEIEMTHIILPLVY